MFNLNLKDENKLTGKEVRVFQAQEIKSSQGTALSAMVLEYVGEEELKVVRIEAGDAGKVWSC